MRNTAGHRFHNIQTPFYLYDRGVIKSNIKRLKRTFTPCKARIYFAVKANTSLAVLKMIHQAGVGAEVVSPGEVYLVLEAGFAPAQILYNNIARSVQEILYAMRRGIVHYNFEALDQAEVLESCARSVHKKILLFARINPGIFSDTHPHLSTGAPSSKFGMTIEELPQIISLTRRFTHASLVGLHSHIGSQILSSQPFVRNTRILASIMRTMNNHKVKVKYINLGGGFGIPYTPHERPLRYAPIVRAYRALSQEYGVKIMLEPGRSIVGDAGILVSRVISIKKRSRHSLYVIDAGMTENPRPALYGAYHHITVPGKNKRPLHRVRVTGPLCENTDEFGTYRLPELNLGDIVYIHNCGAYARTMASNYNGRLLPAEYMVRGDTMVLIRKRQHYRALVQDEIH